MFKNYLKIAFRNIWKNKVFSFINIIGLSIGLSAAFVIGAMIYYDLTFDKFHPDRERIFRITSDFMTPEGDFHNRGVAVPIGKYAKEDMTGFETVSTFFTQYLQSIENEETAKTYRNIEDAIITDANYFDLFNYKWLAGSPTSLSQPGQLVLTLDRAARYFPNLKPHEIMGRVLIYNDGIPMTISGIVEDPKQRTDLYFKEFLSLETVRDTPLEADFFNNEWNSTNSSSMVFVKIVPNTDLTTIQKQLDAVAYEHADKQMYDLGQRRNFRLQPLADIHFNGVYGIFNNSKYVASKTVLVSLGLAALFLLLLGCINFINLNTAQATKRAKEIGIRKTLGSSRKQLVFQFLGETFLLTLSATIASVYLASWLFQVFTDFIPEGVAFSLFSNPLLITSLVVLLLLITFLSGFYPALVLSDYKPVSVLKNQIISGNEKTALRKYLTVFQFVIAQIFIVATFIVGKQLSFLMSKDMGFKTEANAYVRVWHNDDLSKRVTFAEAITKIPEVSLISLANDPPASNNSNSTIATFIDDTKEINTDLQQLFGDINYLKVYDIELLAGRDRLNDTIQEYVINETYAKILGFQNPTDALGKLLKFDDGQFPIVGVMKDFHQRSLRSNIQPMALIGDSNRDFYTQFNTLHFSLNEQASKNLTHVITKVENAWKSVFPEYDFEIHFMDDTIKQFYEQERKTSALLKWATGLAILISCLGLLGLVIHTTERRTKEIGIRKVLGASLAQLNLLLCKEFLILVGIAFVIAVPIAWYGLDNWLQDFAYKTELSWWVFALSGLAMLLITLFIISIRIVAAANRNPVKSLRTD